MNNKNCPKVEEITYNGKVIALIIRKNFMPDGIQFFSPKEYPLQLGAMSRPKGYQITPHLHNPVRRQTISTQEVLFIQSGEVRINFYSPAKTFLESSKLNAGDIILLVDAGHGIEFLKKSVIFEVKNGPFILGEDKSKFTNARLKK